MSIIVTQPFLIFYDRSGQPLDAGYIYIGLPGINPEVSPITVYWDSSLTTTAAQPIRTLAGYPSRDGTPSSLFIVQSSYSIVVRDKTGALVYSDLNVSTDAGTMPETVQDIAALRALTISTVSTQVLLLSNYVAGDGGGIFRYDSTDTTTADNSGTVIVDTIGRRWKRQYVGPVNALWFASTVNAGIIAAIAAGIKHIQFDQSWTWTSTITPSTFCIIEGVGRRQPIVTRAAAGTMFVASAEYCQFLNFIVQGVGATYSNTTTDRVFTFATAFQGNQRFERVGVFDSAGPCWEITTADAGFSTTFIDCSGTRTTTTNAAFVGPAVTETVGARDFYAWRGGGSTFIRPNGMINTRIVGGDCTNMDFAGSAAVSLRMMVSSLRIASGASTLDIAGSDILFDNCSFSGDVTLNANSARVKISNYTQAVAATIVDNSTSTGDNVNEVVEYAAAFTPTWKADSVDPALGNGTLTGRVRISGKTITVNIQLAIGSTTTFGTGNWYFTLPAPYTVWTARAAAQGSVWMLDTGTGFHSATSTMAAGSGRIYIVPTGANNVNATIPFTWANGDTLTLTLAFEKG